MDIKKLEKKYVGQIIGDLEILRLDHVNAKNKKFFVCKCIKCGKDDLILRLDRISSGHSFKCDCPENKDARSNNMIRRSNGQFLPINHNDIIGKKIGKLTVISLDHISSRRYFYKCKCDCGNEVIKRRDALLNNLRLECDECYKKSVTESAVNEFIGKKFGRLTVISLDHLEEDNGGQNQIYYSCRCDCGNIKVVNKHALASGTIKSCGCFRSESARESHITHGMSGTKFYKTWSCIISRCTNQNDSSYYNYGARGITVCDRWLKFENFRDDMYDSFIDHIEKFGKFDTTIERINVNGNYEPSNCTWATRAEQNRNMTTNIRLYYNGEEYIAAELKRKYIPNIDDRTFYNRLNVNGYKSGDTIDPNTCYETIFRGSIIKKAIYFIDNDY